MLLQHVIDIIESVAPLSYQADWDNSGLQVGNPSANVEAALLTIDLTEAVVDEAIARGCQLIISHHPLLFHGLRSVCGRTPQERIVELAIRHDIAIYSSHTSMDEAPLNPPCRGRIVCNVSGKMAEKLGITDYHILARDEQGISNPYPSQNDHLEHGLGVIGELEIESFEALLERVKKVFHAPMLRYIEASSNSPKRGRKWRVAICGGAAAEFIDEAIRQGADVYISADMKYHEMQAAAGHIGLIDMDHWVSEQFTREIFAELLAEKVQTYIAETDASPVQVYQ